MVCPSTVSIAIALEERNIWNLFPRPYDVLSWTARRKLLGTCTTKLYRPTAYRTALGQAAPDAPDSGVKILSTPRGEFWPSATHPHPVSYTHLRAHETLMNL
eukprot:5792085-Prymnesium_polylepis.1